jgi:limonene-1,2-epoxide hydrolase
MPIGRAAVPIGRAAVPAGQAGAFEVVADFLHNLADGNLDACCSAFSATALIDEAESLPFGGIRVGPKGFAELVATVGRLYKMRLGPPTIDASGNTVFVRFDITLTSRRTGNWTQMSVVDVYTVEGGMITGLDVYYKDSADVSRVNTPEQPQPGAAADET